MEDTKTLLDILTDLKLLVAFVLVVVPGFLSVRAYESIRGSQPRKINESLVDVIIYGFATVALSTPVYYLLLLIPDPRLRRFALLVAVAVSSLVIPVLLARLWCRVQIWLAASGYIADPDLKPWDRIFRAIKSEKSDVGIILTLPDGRRLGGRFGRQKPDDGFASSYPADEQLLIGELWTISEEGRFVSKIVGNRGMLIDKKDVLALEFVDWTDVVATLGAPGPVTSQEPGPTEGKPSGEPKPELKKGG